MNADEAVERIIKAFRDEIEKNTQTVLERVKTLENKQQLTGDDVAGMVETSIAAAEEKITKAAQDFVAQEVKKIPHPKNGEDGQDGKSVTADEVAAAMEGQFAKWALEFERKADGVLTKAVDRLKQPENGKDAVQLDGFEISLDDDGRTMKLSMKADGREISREVKIPSVIYRGVFRHGEKYEKGDALTYGGSLWIAVKDEAEGVPGTCDDYKLAVKRGRDGRESVKVEHHSGQVKAGGN